MQINPARQLADSAASIILGKHHTIRLAVSCLIARGHLLIEDVPGVGKTTLAHTLAHLAGLPLQRIQFTSDLLPADITGVSIFDRDKAGFRFHPGPIFTPVLLADEVNRATPKTQSALLEAMEERQVTTDGQTLALPNPFFVIATQNPSTQLGTFPLPESQLDRFMMRVRLGFPDPAAERALLLGEDRRSLLQKMPAITNADGIVALQAAVSKVTTHERLIDYVQALLTATRNDHELGAGLSPRAGLALLAAARAWAWLDNRQHVLPEDVQAVFPAVAGHRLHLGSDGRGTSDAHILRILRSVPV